MDRLLCIEQCECIDRVSRDEEAGHPLCIAGILLQASCVAKVVLVCIVYGFRTLFCSMQQQQQEQQPSGAEAAAMWSGGTCYVRTWERNTELVDRVCL